MKKERGKIKSDNIFSPRNLLIAFIVIILLLLIFNYFYPIISSNLFVMDQNNNQGELYSLVPIKPIPGGACAQKNCDSKCEECIESNPSCNPKPWEGRQCQPGSSGDFNGICSGGRCVKCDLKCGECGKCDIINGEQQCVSKEGIVFCNNNKGICLNGKCGECGSEKCGQCQKCDFDSNDFPFCVSNSGAICYTNGPGICDGGRCPVCDKDCSLKPGSICAYIGFIEGDGCVIPEHFPVA